MAGAAVCGLLLLVNCLLVRRGEGRCLMLFFRSPNEPFLVHCETGRIVKERGLSKAKSQPIFTIQCYTSVLRVLRCYGRYYEQQIWFCCFHISCLMAYEH
jgi:hypothetical protein